MSQLSITKIDLRAEDRELLRQNLGSPSLKVEDFPEKYEVKLDEVIVARVYNKEFLAKLFDGFEYRHSDILSLVQKDPRS